MLLTVTSTVPLPRGLTAVIVPVDSTFTFLAAAAPNITVEPGVNPEPSTVTARDADGGTVVGRDRPRPRA